MHVSPQETLTSNFPHAAQANQLLNTMTACVGAFPIVVVLAMDYFISQFSKIAIVLLKLLKCLLKNKL